MSAQQHLHQFENAEPKNIHEKTTGKLLVDVEKPPIGGHCPPEYFRPHTNYLIQRAIPVWLAARADVHFVGPRTIEHYKKTTGLALKGEAVLVKYRSMNAEILAYRARVLDPEDGETKALASKGSAIPWIPWLMVDDASVWTDPSVPITFTEAWQKALALMHTGRVCIGLGGVDAGFHDAKEWRNARHLVLHAHLRPIQWTGRIVYIAYDAGIAWNPLVALAAAKLARVLMNEGAKVRLPILPPDMDLLSRSKDRGPDDFLASHGANVYDRIEQGAVSGDPVERIRESLPPVDLLMLTAEQQTKRAEAVQALLRDLPFLGSLLMGGKPVVAMVAQALTERGIKMSARDLNAKVVEFEQRVRAKIEGGKPDWSKALDTTADGTVKSSFPNATTIMVHDPAWKDVLAYDQFSNRILFTKAPPWSDEAASNVTIVIGDAWSDTDADRLVDWLGRTWKVNISPEMAGRLAILIARKSTKNPLREYLVAMAKVWDQAPRIDRFAITHLGAEATPYHLLVGRFALMQSAARGLMPGCIAQHVPVLEGDQDLGKSTAIKRLSPNVRWVSETPFSIGTKDGYVALQGKWLVELAEAETLMRAENRAAKAFFTAESDSYRVPYGKINEDFPRPCVFWATINPEGEGYLRDPTGNRRYWPIACGRIDLAAIERDRDQLWGEAAARVLAGERYHPETADEKRLCGEVQNERREIPVIHDKIASAVAAYNHVTTAYLFEQVLGVKLAEVKNAEQTRVCSVLTSLGFESKTVRFKHPEDEKRSFVRRVWTRRVPLDPLHEKAFVPSDDGASNIALDPRATMKSPMEHDWLGGLS